METAIDRQDSLEHCKYFAFISYSHHDSDLAKWLHRSLESYRIPRRLVGKSGRDGPIPKKIFPIFRDSAELSVSSSLTEEIRNALQSAKYLIVICSPHSAQSEYVNEEIKFFQSIRSSDRMLSIIIAGEPNTELSDDGRNLECLPESMRRVHSSTLKDDQGKKEPLAADIRKGKDEKSDARLRIISGILGLAYDELKQREKNRTRQRRLILSAVGVLVAATVAFTWQTQEIAKRQKVIDSYIAIGQRELELGNTRKAAIYLSHSYSLGGTDDRLRFLLAEAMPSIDIQGKNIAELNSPINSLLIDRDERYLLSLSGNSEINVWDISSGGLTARIDRLGRTENVMFSPDGTRILTCGLDRKIKVWNTKTGTLLGSLDHHKTPIISAALSPDGRFLTSIGVHNTANIWEISKLKSLQLLDYKRKDVFIEPPALFNSTGTRLITKGKTSDGSRLMLIWNPSTGKLVKKVSLPNDSNILCYRSNGRQILSSCQEGHLEFRNKNGTIIDSLLVGKEKLIYAGKTDSPKEWVIVNSLGEIQVWNLEKRERLALFQTGIKNSKIANFDGRHIILIALASQSQVFVWDVQTGTHLATAKIFNEDLRAVAWQRSVKLLVTGSDTGKITNWHLNNRRRNYNLPGNSDPVNLVKFSPINSKLVSCGFDTSVRVWDIATGSLLSKLSRHNSVVEDIEFSKKGHMLMTVDRDGGLGLWDMQNYQLVGYYPDEGIKDIEIAEKGDSLLLALNKGDTINLWHAGKGNPARLDKPRVMVSDMSISPNGKLLASGNEYGMCEIWDLATSDLRFRLWGHSDKISNIDYSPDSHYLLTTSTDGSAIIWSLKKGDIVSSFSQHVGGINTGVFSPDGRLVITAGKDGIAHLWDPKTGERVFSLDSHTDEVTHVEFSRDGKLVVTGSQDRSIKIWETSSGRLIRSLHGHNKRIGSMTISHDGTTLAATSGSTMKLWDLRFENRSIQQIREIIQSRTKLDIIDDKLVVSDQRTVADQKSQKKRPHQQQQATLNVSIDDDQLTTPENTVDYFLETLKEGAQNELSTVVDSDADWEIRDLPKSPAESLKELYRELFSGAKLMETDLRIDGNAAAVTLSVTRGKVDVFLYKRKGIWKIIKLHARSHS